ncbi:MAG: ATP-binding cassette domain-containing protein [Candidatus Cloacimonetes bacterium]|nr:ATP-binding cassette domain-containing protein [Candidatus Cloacimonadota bacterium]
MPILYDFHTMCDVFHNFALMNKTDQNSMVISGTLSLREYLISLNRSRTFKEYAGRMLHGRNKSQPKEIMALDDFSFQVNKKEVVGVNGAIGSGNSTLLRVLGGITHPSERHKTFTMYNSREFFQQFFICNRRSFVD